MAKADRRGSALAAHPEPETNDITERELESRKAFLEFRDADLEHLTAINDVARRYADDVIDDFYRHLLSFDEARAFFGDQQVLQRVRSLQRTISWS